MDYLSIFQGILSTKGMLLDIYFNGLYEREQLGSQSNDQLGFVQHITSLLTTSTTVALGLRLLDSFIESCPVDVLEKKGNMWTTLVLKAANNKDDDTLVFHVLNKIIERSEKVPDMAKFFITTHISKIYDSLTGLPSFKSKYALNCMETCLRIYPDPSVASRGTLERFLWRNVDHVDYEIVQNFGKCLHLLQQVKSGGVQGVSHKTQWKNYQLQLIGGIHSVYNKIFENCVEIFEEQIEQENLPWEKDHIEFDSEPVQKAGQMYIRCRNLVTYLGIALREPFPVEKPILIKQIVHLIIRGLSINCSMLEQNPIADNIALSILLPELHTDLLNLLKVAVTILRGHLRPYSQLILAVMIDELKWTCARNGYHKRFWSLREKVYDVISLWCKTFTSGNQCEIIAEDLFQNILIDITPTQNEFKLKVLRGAQTHISKKTRRQLQNSQDIKSIMVNALSIKRNQKQHFSENINYNLSIAALRCFQEVIFSAANFLKPTILKIMQRSITKISAAFHELPQKSGYLYYNKNCRIEIYKVLYSFLITTHHLCPPPTELILAIIYTAHVRDDSIEVRNRCGFMLQNLEKIIHPQKESLLFMIEARDKRNTFSKICQENLLIQVESNLQTSLCDNSKIDDGEVDNLTNLQVLTTSLTNCANDDMRQDNQTMEINVAIFQNNKDILNENNDPTDVEPIQDQLGDVVEVGVIKNQLVGDTDTLSLEAHKLIENIKIFPETTELLSWSEDNVDAPIVGENTIKNSNISEPLKKKLKLGSNLNETGEMQNLNVNNMDCYESYLVDEIVSQFVDELK